MTTEQGKTFQDAKGDVFRGLGKLGVAAAAAADVAAAAAAVGSSSSNGSSGYKQQ